MIAIKSTLYLMLAVFCVVYYVQHPVSVPVRFSCCKSDPIDPESTRPWINNREGLASVWTPMLFQEAGRRSGGGGGGAGTAACYVHPHHSH